MLCTGFILSLPDILPLPEDTHVRTALFSLTSIFIKRVSGKLYRECMHRFFAMRRSACSYFGKHDE